MIDLLPLRHRLTAPSAVAESVRIHDWLAGQLSPETRRAYASDLRALQMWAAARGVDDLAEVTRTLLITYRDELKAQDYAVSTIARKLSCVRQALGYAPAEGMIDSNRLSWSRPSKFPTCRCGMPSTMLLFGHCWPSPTALL